MCFNQSGNDFPLYSDCVYRMPVILAHQFAVSFGIRTEDGSEFALHAIISNGAP
jgi:hypothetical protein